MTNENCSNSLKIIEKIEKFSKIFDSLELFNQYYELHKDEMNQLTTQRLNKLYKVIDKDHDKNYKITKIKGNICLKRIDQNKNKDKDNNNYQQQIDLLTEKINELTDKFNELIIKINNKH